MQRLKHASSGRAWRVVLLTIFGAAIFAALSRSAFATDQFQYYFGSTTGDAGILGGVAVGAAGDFWLIGFGPEQRIRHLEMTGGSWSGTDNVIAEELNLFHRSTGLAGGEAHSGGGWGPQFGGSANSILLNPAPLTIDVPTSSGGTQTMVYPAGSLAFITDAVGVLTEPSGLPRPDETKKLYRYDLRAVFDSTSVQPDFNTAQFFTGGPPEGEFGVADWNDVFQTVVSEQDLRNQSGSSASDSFGRQFGWSSDGHKIYAIDSSSGQGGIYRIDATRFSNDPTGIAQIWDDGQTNSETDEASLRSEPGILATRAYDYFPANPAIGDQIIVEGSFLSGNSGGVNVFVDTGGSQLAAPDVLFTEAKFREFADYQATSRPRYLSIIADASGDLYISEQQTRMLFRYDTQGRFSKIFSERELDLFQDAQANRPNNDVVTNLSLRTSTSAGFETPEVIYVDAEINAPVGVLVFQPGDFDRDNDVDAVDLAAFAAALQPRNVVVDDVDTRFDLNGNREAFRTTDNDGNPVIRHVSNGQVVVDWKDVKILQQFVGFANGDVNFDGLLDFTDIDVMEANYYTLGGPADKIWTTGDVASIDPDYIFDAVDANLVNLVDLQTLANAWVNDLGQPAVTEADADTQGYTGQFRIDLLAAFASTGEVNGDYNGDGVVDGIDYAVWREQRGMTGSGLAADGNGDLVVNSADFTLWKNNYGRTAPGTGAVPTPTPEPAALALALAGAALAMSLRRRRSPNFTTGSCGV